MLTLFGLALIFIGCTGGIAGAILKALDDADEYTPQLDIPQFKRIASPTGAGMDAQDKDAYIRHLLGELASLKAIAENQTAPTITPGASPPLSPPASPPASPLGITPELPIDAPSNLLKVRDCIIRGMTKTEVLGEVYGLSQRDKTGRPESRYQRCSKLFDRIREDAEAEMVSSVRAQLELMAGGVQHGD